MLPKKIETAFNQQMKNEFESAFLYLSASAYFTAENLDGMAHWMKVQYEEEMKHAFRFYDEIHDRSGRVEVPAFIKPKATWKSPVDVFKDAYKHEQFITRKIDDLVALSKKEGDNAALEFLQWFVNEQVEEEQQVLKIIQTMEQVGPSGIAMVMLDRQLAQRKD